MDEMINKALIKKLRSERCWSQEQLSLVSGLSLRTIQRVENEGNCSLDSKKAIASAFDIHPLSLNAAHSIALSKNDSRLAAALSWLNLVDIGEYADSWKETADLFQSHIKCEDWVEKVRLAREPLGNHISRSIKIATKHDSLPGAPDGRYVVLVFNAVYEKKRSCEEKITLSESGAEWKVVGYFVS